MGNIRCTKRWHDKRIKKKEFTPEDKVFVETEFCPVPRTHAASRKGLLDGTIDQIQLASRPFKIIRALTVYYAQSRSRQNSQ